MIDKIFVNLPVKDLQKSMAFFQKLGFTFNMEFTDDKGACLVLGENIFAMLLQEQFFKSFLRGTEISDAKKETEVLLAIHLESREEVDTMVQKAVEAGGSTFRDPQDEGWMYALAFADPDGHRWEPFFMDEKKRPKNA